MPRRVGTSRLLAGLLLAVTVLLAGCAPRTSGADPGPAGSADPAGATDHRVVRVAAAADLRPALADVVALVRQEDPRIRVDVATGSSGTLVQQVVNGAPFDLYLSADVGYPQQLVDRGLAHQDDLFRYAVGRLVLWAPDGSPLDLADGLAVLVDPRVERIAVANPAHAPYGKAATEAMRRAGVLEAAEPKLVLGENVAQATEFARSGNADVALVARSLVVAEPLRGAGDWVDLPAQIHPGLDQGGVVLRRAADPQAARTVRDVLLGERGRAVLVQYGFTLPEE